MLHRVRKRSCLRDAEDTHVTAAQPAAALSSQRFSKVPKMAAIMMWQMAIPMAPVMRTGFLPTRSIQRTAGMVLSKVSRCIDQAEAVHLRDEHDNSNNTSGKERSGKVSRVGNIMSAILSRRIVTHAKLLEDLRSVVPDDVSEQGWLGRVIELTELR